MKTEGLATFPSVTGEPSGEIATEVILSTGGPYLIQAASATVAFGSMALFPLHRSRQEKGFYVVNHP